MKDSAVQKLAAYSTIKGMVDSKQYKHQYFILAEFIKFIIAEYNLSSFSILQMQGLLKSDFEFDVPYSVVKSSLTRIEGLERSGDDYTVASRQAVRKDFVEINKDAEEDGKELVERLIEYVCANTEVEKAFLTGQLETDFIAYILDRRDAQDLKYGELISKFCLSADKDADLRKKIDRIREGSVLYCGLCYNIIETGSITDEITLYLDTEVLFFLAGYDGTLSLRIATDFWNQVRKANSNGRKVTLSYFREVKQEVDRYFAAAESIVAGRGGVITSRAMQSIVNECETESDVTDKQSDFYHKLEYSYGIRPDTNSETYYTAENYQFNLESSEDKSGDDTKLEGEIRFISHINVLRKGQKYDDYMKSKYIIITETRKLLELSEANRHGHVGFALPISSITNILWMKLGATFGQEAFPANASIAVKARMALDKSIAANVNRTYVQTLSQFKEEKLTEEQAAARILGLQKKMVAPENINESNVDDLIDFSQEALQKFEDAYRFGQIEIAEKDKVISELKNVQKNKDKKLEDLLKESEEKDQTIEKQKELIQSYQDRDQAIAQIKANRLLCFRKILTVVAIVLGAIELIWAIGFLPANTVIGKVVQGVIGLVGFYGGVCTLFPQANIFLRRKKDTGRELRQEKTVSKSSIILWVVVDIVLIEIILFLIFGISKGNAVPNQNITQEPIETVSQSVNE